MQWFWNQYLAKAEDGNNELASPLKAERVRLLPRTMVMTAEHDALRHREEVCIKAAWCWSETMLQKIFKCHSRVFGYTCHPIGGRR